MTFGPIPGETPIDVSELTAPAKARGIRTRAELNAAEAEGVNDAIAKYLGEKSRLSKRIAPFTFDWCLRLHREMYRAVWTWAGRVRRKNVNIGSDHAMVVEELQRLLDDLHSWSAYEMDLLEQSVRLHHRAVTIHPFENGNGRWARLLANIWLRRHAEAVVAWPDKLLEGVSPERDAYLAALRLADDGDYEPLLELHRKHRQQAA